MAKKSDWIIGGLILFSIFFLILIFGIGLWGGAGGEGKIRVGGSRVGIVELKGIILESQRTVRQLKRMQESDAIKAVVLRIDSPGGGVAASQEIYDAVRKLRESGKPVVVSMGSVAASGGYYVACGADTILANPGTTTGSIGVIMEIPNVRGLLSKLGIKYNVIKSGKFKDTGSPFREMRPEERKYLQQFIDDAFQQFVSVVAENRNLPKEKVLAIADGRVFTGKQALKLGLIDALGNYQDAVELAWKMAGLKGKPRIYRVPKRKLTIFDLIFGDLNEVLQKVEATPSLKYQLKLDLPASQ